MDRKGWYMFAYDIAEPKRLGRVHRLMKQSGLAVQKSVFFVQGTEQQIERLLDKLAKIIKNSEDDIRAYPVVHPSRVWTTGGPLETFPLLFGSGNKAGTNLQQKKESRSFWKRFLEKFIS